MKPGGLTNAKNWLGLKPFFHRNGLENIYGKDELPLRSELFSADQLEQHGKTLASWHKLSPGRAPDQLLARLAENEAVLTGTCNLLTATIKENNRIPPAGEWLLDNFYLIEDQILTARRHLPRSYSRELPRLINGPSAGLPRVYDIALETISHGDGRLDLESLSRFVDAYQSVTELKLGELWAIPIMLRLALIENLRRVAARIAAGCVDRELAGSWADQMMEIAEKDPKSLILVIADMTRSGPPMVSAFVSELARRLQGHGTALALPLTWIEQRLSESGLTIEQLVQAEIQQQAADHVSISNSIASLRFLDAMDWSEFVEAKSIIEQTLREDPSSIYSNMEFASRDRYRHVIENLAKKTSLSEGQLARLAIKLTQENIAKNGLEDRSSHVGFYLIDKGRHELEDAANIQYSVFRILQTMFGKFPLVFYLSAIVLVTAAFTCCLLVKAYSNHLPQWLLALLGIIFFVCASQPAVILVNWLVALLVAPHSLPRMDFAKGIPLQFRTLVVVPTMLTSKDNIENLLEALEVRFLANRDQNLHFGLLTDFEDAQQQTLPEDHVLLNIAVNGIQDLNQKYGSGTFCLFHRERKWNAKDRIWMGYERKRGKLADLNAFLRGATDCFSFTVGETAGLSTVKYVITLDADTQLPRTAARQFVGAMAHPLNRAYYDKEKKRVCEGYGILQPRLAVSLPISSLSAYARLYGSEAGIDPYTRAVSDIYQDVFGEGSFIGKGIYDVDILELSLKGRFPDNRILSHDLLEGCYARSGLLSDVQLYEEYPSSYSTDMSRRHRWIRGDWQLLNWLLPEVPLPDNQQEPNPLSALSHWKIFDNLRRSLVPVSFLSLLLFGWIVLSPAWFWTLIVMALILLPPLIVSILEIFRKPDDMPLSDHLGTTIRSTGLHLSQALFSFTCLPYEACLNMSAIIITLWRMLVTHKALLAWNTFAETDRKRPTSFASSYQSMCCAPIIASITMIYLFLSKGETLIAAEPILCLWLICPAIAWLISQPMPVRGKQLTVDQIAFLRKLARKTWAFFETMVGEDDNWLPPDNFQEHPMVSIAHRTSPTNIGLALLSNLTAYDFGYITTAQLLKRTASTLQTMERLERHRGHFYNWYDTQTLKPLQPTYISTVDSGNLAGNLLILRVGFLAISDQFILSPQLLAGYRDTFSILQDSVSDGDSSQLAPFKEVLESSLHFPATTLSQMRSYLEGLATEATKIAAALEQDANDNTQWWAQALAQQCSAMLDELTFLTPWTALPEFSEQAKNIPRLDEMPTLAQLAEIESILNNADEAKASSSDQKWIDSLRPLITVASQRAKERLSEIERLAGLSGAMAIMDYDFLYDKVRRLLSIGYNITERRLDTSYYDLLASEARLCNFIAIAQEQLPQESWFALGRLLTIAGGEPILFSWSGSMFEYLMPLLVMPNYENTLLAQTCNGVVQRQIDYGKQRGVPWGISESAFNKIDVNLNYQYRAFGVPGLGLQRGLAEDLVIAPYASMLALMVAPEESCQNLQKLVSDGFVGKFGLYEAIDYTPSRVPRGQSCAVVRSFMAHHQGMSFLSLAYVLLNQPMQKRFESELSFQATQLLLQERIPKAVPFYSETAKISALSATSNDRETPVRIFNSPDTATPEIQLLSNGRYHVMVTNSGSGYSRWKDIAVTRWREDTTCDNWGTFCYIRDVTSGEFWSAAYQPTLKKTETYEAILSEPRVEFRRRGFDCDTHAEIVVSSEDDIELRRVRITNRSKAHRHIEVTSYAEVVLASPIADALHPAFSNLFVQTEIVPQRQAIVCTRRPRSVDEQTPWMFHLMTLQGAEIEEISHETDRKQFIGRGNTSAHPEAMKKSGPLSNTDGSVLDPIVSIRYQISLAPEESATINIITGIGDTREICLGLIEKYQDHSLADRVFDLAWTHSQVVLRQINANESDAQLYGRLASSVIYVNPSLRADSGILVSNRRGQSGLWGYAVSGDLPIVLLQVEDSENIDLVRQLVQAHAYWRLKGLAVDLVIWNEDHAGYRQLLQEQIMGLIAAGLEANIVDRPGGIFVRPAEQISSEDRILFQAVARAIITDKRGTLAEQIGRRNLRDVRVPRLVTTRTHRLTPIVTCPWHQLVLFNGVGGFTPDGREYVITIAQGQTTPAPWVNVLANPYFGTVISECGSSYTWSENAHEFRITPWQNDPVSDSGGEAIYIRDEESGLFWSPTPLPIRGEDTYYISRHGFGYSVFEHTEGGIISELCVYVAKDAPVKFSVLKLRNDSGRARRLSVTGYVEWVLGDLRSKSAMHVVTEIDPNSGALLARNPYNTEFTDRVAFFDVDDPSQTLSGDRTEFLGRNGTYANPAAMAHSRLSGRVGAGMDPCGAIQVSCDLADGQEREIIFRLGVGQNIADASKLVHRFRGSIARRDSFEALCEYWKHTLGTVNVDTPDQSLNMLVNGWLLYQTIACRLWARSGYYQSGGAFGFRDQLQDIMALIHAQPQLMREHLLRCASHQFQEGDVQHWWHPPSGRGVRTHCSDDYLWLPLATCRYVVGTGDMGVLDEQTPYLYGRPVNPEDDSYYDLPVQSQETGTLYEHCVRAICRGLTSGAHGLPLIGSCDWNDGFNLVGKDGKGESVWLGFFLYQVLTQFIGIANLRGDTSFAQQCQSEAARIRENIENSSWDGQWYRRAYFDDGTPLGSSSNPECQIDSIAQSWSVLSGAGDPERSRQAMASLNEHLVNRQYSLIQLLKPPFDKSDLNPGYIKGYVPGVRENGGQYTHGAIWAAMAFAALGDNQRAWELLSIINPVRHANSSERITTYKVEPYVVAADVYAVAPHTGSGGWTWYTGSAGWLYRLIVESLFGLRLEVNKLHFAPCLPADWDSFKIHYRYRETVYHITVVQTHAPDDNASMKVVVDGAEQPDGAITLIDDRREHSVTVQIAIKN